MTTNIHFRRLQRAQVRRELSYRDNAKICLQQQQPHRSTTPPPSSPPATTLATLLRVLGPTSATTTAQFSASRAPLSLLSISLVGQQLSASLHGLVLLFQLHKRSPTSTPTPSASSASRRFACQAEEEAFARRLLARPSHRAGEAF